MTFESETVGDLVRIAAAGGGFKLVGTERTTSELIKIASAAASGKAQLTLVGVSTRTLSEIIKIANAGDGCVVFED